MRLITRVLFAIVVLLTGIHTAAATTKTTKKKILLFPLTINADRDVGALEKGVQAMLMSRLTVPGRMTPIENLAAVTNQTITSPAQALDLAQHLEADFVVIGSLTFFGDTFSTDIQVFETTRGRPRFPSTRWAHPRVRSSAT